VRLAHPLLGQVTAQKEQPQHRKKQSFLEHISHYLNYFQSGACWGHHYPLIERVLLIIGRLHLTWRDAMKNKYTQLVPQNGTIPPNPLQCHLEMLGVTLTQRCKEECMELPSSRTERSSLPSAPVFAIDNVQDSLADLYLSVTPPQDLLLGHTKIDSAKLENAIVHMVCYIDRGGTKSTYPKCDTCGLARNSAEKCFPLINLCIAQTLASQHPEVVRKIKAAYKQFPRNARSRTPRKATVKQIVAFLDLPTTEDMLVLEDAPLSDASDFVTSLYFPDPQLFHCKVGSALVTYKDQPWYSPHRGSPIHTIQLEEAPLGPCVIYSEHSTTEHSI
jgi:hypothetical protein